VKDVRVAAVGPHERDRLGRAGVVDVDHRDPSAVFREQE